MLAPFIPRQPTTWSTPGRQTPHWHRLRLRWVGGQGWFGWGYDFFWVEWVGETHHYKHALKHPHEPFLHSLYNLLGHMTAVEVAVDQVYGIGSHQCRRRHDLHWEADEFLFIVFLLILSIVLCYYGKSVFPSIILGSLFQSWAQCDQIHCPKTLIYLC